LDKELFQAAYDHLTSRDLAKAWTSGQWMTKRAGGSDVRNTETLATYSPMSKSEALSTGIDGMPLGPWLINGFKWFSSATDANMATLLAKTPDGGISAFYAPTRRTLPQKTEAEDSSLITTELNGITIHRLKSKLGTRFPPNS
jgi:alkylation response protein AidB-like acyl-CoA dehydrogenase